MNVLDLFSGIGGFSLAAHQLGWRTLAFVEKDKFCQQILKNNFGEIPIYEDITSFSAESFCGITDIVTGGFPCQPFSKAGKQRGKDDKRELSHEMLRVIRETMPRWVVAENVRGLLSNKGGVAFENICADLECEGYEIQPFIIPSYSKGFSHQRERVWIIARRFEDADFDSYTSRGELGTIRDESKTQRAFNSNFILGSVPRVSWLSAISRIHGIFNGVSRRLDKSRNRVLGNSLQPQIALEIFKGIEYAENNFK